MRFCNIFNFFGSAEFNKSLENVAYERIVHSRNQLSVGKGSRASRAELNIRFSIEDSEFFKSVNSPSSFFNRAASLDKNRTVAVFCQNKSRKQTARSASHNYRRAFKAFLAEDRRNTALVK